MCAVHRGVDMAELGRRGAEATRKRWASQSLSGDELGPLESPADAARGLAQVAVAVATGRLGAQEASVIQRCLTTWLGYANSHS